MNDSVQNYLHRLADRIWGPVYRQPNAADVEVLHDIEERLGRLRKVAERARAELDGQASACYGNRPSGAGEQDTKRRLVGPPTEARVDPAPLFDEQLEELSKAELICLLKTAIATVRTRTHAGLELVGAVDEALAVDADLVELVSSEINRRTE